MKQQQTQKVENEEEPDDEDPEKPISISKDMLGDKKSKEQEIKKAKELSEQEADLVKRLAKSKTESKFEFLGLHFARHK